MHYDSKIDSIYVFPLLSFYVMLNTTHTHIRQSRKISSGAFIEQSYTPFPKRRWLSFNKEVI